jgi:hypothetical protein
MRRLSLAPSVQALSLVLVLLLSALRPEGARAMEEVETEDAFEAFLRAEADHELIVVCAIPRDRPGKSRALADPLTLTLPPKRVSADSRPPLPLPPLPPPLPGETFSSIVTSGCPPSDAPLPSSDIEPSRLEWPSMLGSPVLRAFRGERGGERRESPDAPRPPPPFPPPSFDDAPPRDHGSLRRSSPSHTPPLASSAALSRRARCSRSGGECDETAIDDPPDDAWP